MPNFDVSVVEDAYRVCRLSSKAHFGGCDVYHLYITAPEFVNALKKVPEDINPRRHDSESALVCKGPVRRDIIESLTTCGEHFGILNRGVTILARSVSREGSKARISIPNSQKYGLLDGGTTRAVLLQYYKEYLCIQAPEDQEERSEWQDRINDWEKTLVHVEVLVPESEDFNDDLMTTLAGARNTSRQVRDADLFNHQGVFERLHTWLDHIPDQHPERRTIHIENIAFTEGSVPADRESIDIKQLVPLLAMFLPKFDEDHEGNNPTYLYASPMEELQEFAEQEKADIVNKTQQSEYLLVRDIATDICNLHDYVYANVEKWYDMGIARKLKRSQRSTEQRTKIVAGKPLIRCAAGEKLVLPLTGRTCDLNIPRAFLYPFMFGLTALLKHGEQSKNQVKPSSWITNPFDFLDKHGQDLMTWYYDKVIMKDNGEPGVDRRTKIGATARDVTQYALVYKEFELKHYRPSR